MTKTRGEHSLHLDPTNGIDTTDNQAALRAELVLSASTTSPPATIMGGGSSGDHYGDAQAVGTEGMSVQALRSAMKSAIRERYSFEGTAKLWAATLEDHAPIPDDRREDSVPLETALSWTGGGG